MAEWRERIGESYINNNAKKSARQLEFNIYRKNFEAYLQISQYVCRQQRNDVPVLILE